MKNITYLLVLISLLLCSCEHQRHYRIGVSQCSDDDWRAKMNGEMLREIMFHPEVTLDIRSANDDSQRQIADLMDFINEGVDLIIVAPNEAEALTPVIRDIYEAGIPVLVFDRSINGDYYTAFQGADNAGIGAEAAKYAVWRIPDNPSVLEIKGLESSTPALERSRGFISRLHELVDTFNIVSVPGLWTYEDAYPVAFEALKNHTDINIVYAHNDRMALAASDAANKLGVSPVIIGIDAAPDIGMKAVEEGRIDATFLYPTEGARIIKTALAILGGEPFDSVVTIPPSNAVTASNVGVLLRQYQELALETQHLELLKSELDDYWARHNTQTIILVAAGIILVLAFGVIFTVLKAVWIHKNNREKLSRKNAQLEEQKNELISLNQKLNDATQSKLMFFTNVSHDLRTPITLISEPVALLATADNLTEQQHSLVRIADKNIRILRRLINQILDFRKYENDKLPLSLTEIDLGHQMSEWLSAFSTLARKRHIDLKADLPPPGTLVMAIDVEKIERVCFNLVSNAFKYSPDNATISVKCHLKDDTAIIVVSDTGKGIPANEIKNVFERFFQVEKVHPTGSGIGLSLAKAFVEMHGGTISVESEEGHGSTFTVTIPVKHVAEVAEEVTATISETDVNSELDVVDTTPMEVDTGKPVLLVIDDNEDILSLVSQLLGDEYNIITARNGKQGIKMATKYIPDVIVCDVMMPVMDGLECCRNLKEEISTSHIPVLMLTACSMDEQRVQGFESGADGYLSKPFNTDVLKAQVRNLIRNRNLIKNLWQGSKTATPISEEPTRDESTLKKGVSNIDNEFYQRFVDLVEKNMSDPELSVDRLAQEMGFARSQFYRKIKALSNYSPVELLRSMRLRAARRLLTTTEKSISEVGYDVGFSSAAYFSKCFHDEFGETPSQLRERLGH